MRTLTRRAILGSLPLYAAAGHALSAAATDRPRSFTVFDGLIYKPMPDLRNLGMPKLLDIGSIWSPGIPKSQVDPTGIRTAVAAVRRRGLTRYYFDLEEWTVSGAPREVIDANIQKLARTAEIARQSAPQLKFGFYDQAPRGNYWPIITNNQKELAEWYSINRSSAIIAAKVDYLFPSLYTFYDDPAGWELTSRAVIKEARQYGKPVYPFLMPEFHDSNAKLRDTQIPPEFWRRQLELCRELADGLVIWGGWLRLWDEEAPWWVETKSFMASLGYSVSRVF
ncbi:MAG TPA: hypothetical protein VHB68_14150 [Steroidobacteraceae bacterium]|nr:hypothetical protein [Steroidobacteraceae bacterium]